MPRNIRCEGIVLKSGRVGEIHKSVTFLTPDSGVVEAIAHGVYKGKGKLSSGTDPFARSILYLYYEPVKQSYKVVDLEVLDLFEGVREDLDRYYAATLWAEVILKSHAGGGGWPELFALLTGSLEELAAREDPKVVEIQFLWRYVAHAGFLPDLRACGSCGKGVEEQAEVYHRRSQGDFVCSDCAEEEGLRREDALLSAGAKRYLLHSEQLPLREALTIGLAALAKKQAARILYAFVQDMVETPLRTLESGLL